MTSWFELRISIQTIAESFPFFSSDSLVPTETKFKHRVQRTSADDIFFYRKNVSRRIIVITVIYRKGT